VNPAGGGALQQRLIKATAFHRLPEEAGSGLAAEADGLVAFLADRDPMV